MLQQNENYFNIYNIQYIIFKKMITATEIIKLYIVNDEKKIQVTCSNSFIIKFMVNISGCI